jgi:hypothetical protein
MRGTVCALAVCALLAWATPSRANPDALKSVRVRGTLYDVGNAVGSAFATSIRAKLAGEGYQALWTYIQTPPGSVQFADMRNAVNSSAEFRPFLEEVRGLADGANISYDKALMMQMGDELENLSGDHVDHCTDVLAPTATGQGTFYPAPEGVEIAGVPAHNEDGGRINYGLTYLLEADVVDATVGDHSFTAYCYPGQLPTGAFGFNSFGVFFTTNGLFPKVIDSKAVPRHFVSRKALASPTTGSVIELLERTRVACGFSLNLGSTAEHHRLWNIETAAGDDFSVLEVSKHLSAADPSVPDYSFHMNEFLRLEAAQTPDPSSAHRLARAEAMAAPTDVASVLDILGDTTDPSYPIYRTGAPPDEYATLATATFELFNTTTASGAGGRMWIQLNNPKECKPLIMRELPAN